MQTIHVYGTETHVISDNVDVEIVKQAAAATIPGDNWVFRATCAYANLRGHTFEKPEYIRVKRWNFAGNDYWDLLHTPKTLRLAAEQLERESAACVLGNIYRRSL